MSLPTKTTPTAYDVFDAGLGADVLESAVKAVDAALHLYNQAVANLAEETGLTTAVNRLRDFCETFNSNMKSSTFKTLAGHDFEVSGDLEHPELELPRPEMLDDVAYTVSCVRWEAEELARERGENPDYADAQDSIVQSLEVPA